MKSELTLVGLDIEGEWNLPLLANAAQISGADLLFARSSDTPDKTVVASGTSVGIDAVLDRFDHVLACEAVPRSRSVYDVPVPRGRVGVIVGNELHGIPKNILKKADQVVSIPMLGRGLSSINVAVAAAIVLYAIERDFGRRRFRTAPLSHRDVDCLICGVEDPSELGSLLRSAWAFGWQRVFLVDRAGIWFTADRPTILAGRAAARCEVNHIVVSPQEQMDFQGYDQIVVCGNAKNGTPLSRFTLRDSGKVLIVYGDAELRMGDSDVTERIYIDHAGTAVEARFRHAGSILLSMLSQSLRGGRRG